MISYPEAREIIYRNSSRGITEWVALDEALGRVLAESVVADRDYPPFDRSAMDGIAVRLSDLQQGRSEFDIAETVYPGAEPGVTLNDGACYKIMTGAGVPRPASVVIKNEELQFGGGRVRLPKTLQYRELQNIARKGQDVRKNCEVLAPGQVIRAGAVSLLASLGKSTVRVMKQPRIAVFTTGNEIVPVDHPVSQLQVRNSNRHLVRALLAGHAIRPVSESHVEDDQAALHSAFTEALPADLLLVTGGASAGDRDFVPRVLQSLGFVQLVHQVAIKPGKPVWCGKRKDGALALALPGNPFACMVTFKLFAEAFILAFTGQALPAFCRMPLLSCRQKKGSFDEFFPARILPGKCAVEQLPLNGSGDIRLGLQADVLALHPAAKSSLVCGDEIDCLRL